MAVARDTVIRARVTKDTKDQAVKVFHKLGLSTSEAINLFLTQVRLKHALPFDIEVPNEETAKEIRETRKGKGLIKCKDVDDLFKRLGLDDTDIK